MTSLLIILASIIITVIAGVVLVFRRMIQIFGDDFEEDEEETLKEIFLQAVRDYFYPIKFIAKGLQSKVRAILGAPPRAEKARRKAQRKKAGV